MMKKRTGFLNIVLIGACLVSVLSGCQKEEMTAPEVPAVNEATELADDSATEGISENGYILKEVETDDAKEKKKDITDTDMSASDRARLDNLIDEIGKEIDE